jgi:hypothetical protein
LLSLFVRNIVRWAISEGELERHDETSTKASRLIWLEAIVLAKALVDPKFLPSLPYMVLEFCDIPVFVNFKIQIRALCCPKSPEKLKYD